MLAIAPLLASLAWSQATEKVLYNFNGGSDGADPTAGLIRDSEGNFYGTTLGGGPSSTGTVFKLDPTGNETVLYSFAGGSDGATPHAGVLRDTSGSLYGTTWTGGTYGAGTVFKLSPTGTETVLYSFTGGSDGGNPGGALVQDPQGNLYGTTHFGGAQGSGTVFKLDSGGTETVLHTFTGADGSGPSAGLVLDTNGILYGTTEFGGASGWGTVFKLETSGVETVLHSFTGGADGGLPLAHVIQDAQGNLYGTTVQGGSSYGVVFKVDPTGAETVLYSFTGGSDGAAPYPPVIQDTAGNLYGMTYQGGIYGYGVVFKVDPTGHESVLYSFTENVDEAISEANLLLDSVGNLYGTTRAGGTSNNGTVFEITGVSSPFLDFPLGGKDPYSTNISAVFDHAVNADKTTNAPLFYRPNTKVMTFTGEEGVKVCGHAPCSEPVGRHSLVGYKNVQGQPFVVTGGGHYTGGSGCNNGPCNDFLFYTGHSGFDYAEPFGTTVILAPGDGLLFIPSDDPVVLPDNTPGESVSKFNILAIDHGNGYVSWFLHLGCEPGTKDRHCALNHGDFRGIDANGNVICANLSTTGCPVKRGDVIGLVGNKGLLPLVSYAHLHFEVRKGLAENPGGLPTCSRPNCIPVDPYGWTGAQTDPFAQFLGGLPNVKLWK